MRCQDYFYKKQNEVFIVKTCTSQVKRCTKDNTLKKCKLLFTENSAPACAATQQPHFKGSKDSVLHFYCRHVCQTLILKTACSDEPGRSNTDASQRPLLAAFW